MECLGDRISLREWRTDEAEAMHRWLGDPRVGRFLDWAPTDLDGSREHLQRCVAAQSSTAREEFFLAIERLADGEVLGDAGFEWKTDPSGRSEIAFGYFLAHSHWGQGYATEAALLVLDLAFSSLGADRARASCDEANKASERVLVKCGLTRQPEEESPGRRVYRIGRDAWLTRNHKRDLRR